MSSPVWVVLVAGVVSVGAIGCLAIQSEYAGSIEVGFDVFGAKGYVRVDGVDRQ